MEWWGIVEFMLLYILHFRPWIKNPSGRKSGTVGVLSTLKMTIENLNRAKEGGLALDVQHDPQRGPSDSRHDNPNGLLIVLTLKDGEKELTKEIKL